MRPFESLVLSWKLPQSHNLITTYDVSSTPMIVSMTSGGKSERINIDIGNVIADFEVLMDDFRCVISANALYTLTGKR